jgi:hypothetical protein
LDIGEQGLAVVALQARKGGARGEAEAKCCDGSQPRSGRSAAVETGYSESPQPSAWKR